MRILKTPWKNDLMELVAQSQKSIKITSPFIKENICSELVSSKRYDTKLELITSFKLMNIYNGSVDLNGIENIIINNGVVKNLSKIHSKIYLFDDEKAIITSGNLTNGGLIFNYEYGVYIDDLEIVDIVSKDFSLLSNNENTGTVKLSDINAVREIILNIPHSESIKLPRYEVESPENFDILEVSDDLLKSSLKGWKLKVFECVQSIPSQNFNLNEVLKFEDNLKRYYPNNNHIPDKIRQQLQDLRDLGLIEFLGNGHYKKLWK